MTNKEVIYMKNKFVIIIISVVVIIAVIIGAILGIFFLREKTDGDTDPISENSVDFISMLKMTSVSSLKEHADLNGIDLIEYKDEGCWAFSNLPVNHMIVTALFYNDGDKIVGTSSKIEFDTSYNEKIEDKIIQLEHDIDFSLSLCSELFGTDLNQYCKIFHHEGYILDQDIDEAYRLILDRKAYTMMIVKENEQSYWEITGHMEEEKFAIYLERVFENISNEYADIVLE